MKKTAHDRFVKKTKATPSGCIEFAGSKDRDGYGRFWDGAKVVGAHRYEFERIHGPIPDGYVVMHSCDNPSCCNVNHLMLGTQKENIADRDRKGRRIAPAGDKHMSSKLTSEKVREIRGSTMTCKELAAMHGISWRYVSDLRRGLYWK